MNKKSKSKFIVDPRGQWAHPGKLTRIPSNDITMKGVNYPVWAQPNVGPGMLMEPGKDYNFPGADYVDEYPQMKKGGTKTSKKYTRNITALNKLFAENDLFKKPKKKQIFDPNASFYAEGGQSSSDEYVEMDLSPEEIQAYRDGGYVVEELDGYKQGGALLTKKVTCKNCGWTWDAADGGDDITTCHKCGGQGLVHAQDGGMTTTKSKNGTVTNTIKNPDGSKTIQVKTKEGNYYEKEVPMDYWKELDKLKEEYKYQKDYENALDYTGIVAYPAAVASSIIDASEGKYGEAALGLIPFAGKSSRAAQLLRRKVLNKAYQAGLSNKTAQALRKGASNTLVGGTGAAQAYDATGFQNGGYTQNIKEIPSIPLKEGRTAYKRWAYGVNDQMAMEKNGGFIELDLDDTEIENYRKGGYVVEEVKFQDGGVPTVPTAEQAQTPVVTPMLPPDMVPTGDLVAPPTVTEPVIATSNQQPTTIVNTPVIDEPAPTKKEVEKVAMPKIEQSGDVKAIQKKLVAAGYNIGSSGASRDGVDGVMGNKTKMALDAFNSGIPPSKLKTIEPKKQTQSDKYVVNKDLGTGYLPYLDRGDGTEVCVKGKGCSSNVSIKMGNLLGGIAEGDIWANDAWFNKSDVLNKGGDLIYETAERDFTKMPKVPKDVYAKLQVGDYVQLNRPNTKTSGEFAAERKENLQNENLEHLGFIVGKDADGTPLVWHGSEKGKAFIQRIDAPITLEDHDKSIFTYQIASIVRSPSLKNADLSGLQNTPYYSTVDPKNKLVASKTATERQRQATHIINSNVRNIKNLGYSQEDANFVGQILVGGIMQSESSGGTSNKRIPKQIAATVYKDVLGQGEFEGDEASIGYYQMKPTLNFVEKDGSLNALGKKLEKLGVDPKDIGTFDIEAQTKAGAIILLDNYEQLKKDKDFNIKTGLYKGKIPASYILAKSWQAGSGWYKKEKYQKYINNFDVDYSNNVLKNAVNTISNTSTNNQLQKEYGIVKKGITAREKAAEEAERLRYVKNYKKEYAEKAKERAEYEKNNPNFAYSKKVPTESTAVYNPYKELNTLKPLAIKENSKKPTMQSTVYKYPGRPGVTYKKDSNGKWYINTGKLKDNDYIPIKDPSGTRTKALATGAVKAKEGGMVATLTQAEIDRYIKDGYVIEQID